MFERYYEIQSRRSQNPDAGFTLIELLIVIVVLGILAAVVVFALGGVTSSSAVSACNSDAKTVETAYAAYQAQGGAALTGASAALAPTAIDNLTSSTAGTPISSIVNALVPKYLHSWPSNLSHYSIDPNGTTNASTPFTATWNGDLLIVPSVNNAAGVEATTAAGQTTESYDGQGTTAANGCNAVS